VSNKGLEGLEEMQRELAKLLRLKKHKKYPDGAMRVLLEVYPDDIEYALRSGSLEELEQPARGIYRAWEAGAPRESAPNHTVVSERAAEQLGAETAKRAEVFSECLAKLTTSGYFLVQDIKDPSKDRYVSSEVEGFRRKYLDDKLLSPEQARALLTSPVAAHWPRFFFQRSGVPVVGHAYQVTEGMSDDRGPHSLVEVPLPSSKVASLKDRRPLAAAPWELPEKREKAKSNERLKREYKIGYPPRERVWKIVPYPGEDGLTHRVLVEPDSVLGDLYDMVSSLIQRYPWEEPDAVWFVLTGETPQVEPFTWQFRGLGSGIGEDSFRYGFVTLKIEPWVDPKLVWKVYSDIQRGLRNGRRVRRLGPKSLELLRFVNERINAANLSRGERRKVGSELVAAWDGENPDDSFNGNTREFWKAYHRARQAIMSPSYEWRGDG
jgi:hypothetical protein